MNPRKIKARIGELETESIFPIDAAPHGTGSLTVGQALDVLQDED
jgi:hypothetical protein